MHRRRTCTTKRWTIHQLTAKPLDLDLHQSLWYALGKARGETMIYVISDTHFHHEKIKAYCGRPEDYEEQIYKNLNKLTKKDILIHLGDITWGHELEIAHYFRDLPCRVILAKGNHDSKPCEWYINNGFDFAARKFNMKYRGVKICFSHRPAGWDGDWELNICGHLHNLTHKAGESVVDPSFVKVISLELMGYKPFQLNELIKEFKK